MPYKKGSKQNKKKPARKSSSQNNYRQPTARTIQIATRRNMNQTLRFVVNQTYIYDGSKSIAGKTAFLSYLSNSIFNYQILSSTIANEFISQSPLLYSALVADAKAPNATGWDEWTERYQHFIVTGSKMTYTFEPTTVGAPAVLFAHLSGTGGSIATTTTSAAINEKPYTKRHSVAQSFLYGNNASRGSLSYSARNFEGITNPDDNSVLRGRFHNTALGTVGQKPTEQSFYNLALAPVNPAETSAMPSGVIRVKIEYVVHLREPTESNQVQVTRILPEMGGGARFGTGRAGYP